MDFWLSLLLFGFYLVNAQLPRFKNIDQNHFFPEEGTVFTLNCPVLTEGFEIDWYKDENLIFKHYSSILTISNISRKDAGIYRCYVYTDNGGAFSRSFNVTVSCKFFKKISVFFRYLSQIFFLFFFLIVSNYQF